MNAGGVLVLVGFEDLGWTPEELDRRLRGIGDTIARVFEYAESEGVTTNAAALRLARPTDRGRRPAA